jgi:GR25 family glycosyltransferase involved in LPS biosynthesis
MKLELNKFDRIECVCVDNRQYSWKNLIKQFELRSAKVNKFIVGKGKLLPKGQYNQIDPLKSAAGWGKQFTHNAYCCYLAHRAILEKAKKDNLKNLLILEDDCFLLENFDTILEQVNIQIEQTGTVWDTFTFGQNLKWGAATQVSENILKLNRSVYCWHAIAINQEYNNMFDHLLNLPANGPFDYLYSVYTQPKFNCYGVWPSIAVQKPGFSYVNGYYQDYTDWLKECPAGGWGK